MKTITCIQAREEANDVAFISLGDFGEEEEEEEGDKEFKEKKEKVSLFWLWLLPSLDEMDPCVMAEPFFNSEATI